MNLIVSFFAIISILFGLISMVTPIPGGIILIAAGLTGLICSNPTARYCLMWLRSRTSWINRLFFLLENKVGTRIKVIGSALKKTRPPEGVSTSISHREFIENEINKIK